MLNPITTEIDQSLFAKNAIAETISLDVPLCRNTSKRPHGWKNAVESTGLAATWS